MSKIKPIAETKQWMFHYDNPSRNLPYVSSRDYTLIKQSINKYYHIDDRINDLTNRGFEVKLCYIPTYNGIGNLTYMPRLNEIRIIVGRPKWHEPRQVYAVIIKSKTK